MLIFILNPGAVRQGGFKEINRWGPRVSMHIQQIIIFLVQHLYTLINPTSYIFHVITS